MRASLRWCLLSLSFLVVVSLAERCGLSQERPRPFDEFRQALAKTATAAADPCEDPSSFRDDAWKAESSVFEDAAKVVGEALNETRSGSDRPDLQFVQALEKLQAASVDVNHAWPIEARLHITLIDVPPLRIFKIVFGSRARYFVFAIQKPETVGHAETKLWQQIGSDSIDLEHESPRSWLDIFPLRRGPSGHARFLASIGYTGCAGSSGVLYEAYEWTPDDTSLSEVIHQEGSVGMDEAFDGHKPTKKEPFAPVGVLHTEGSKVTLPYCWFSAVDYWDNPSLCAVDTYDLSGDDVVFESREINRPELATIAMMIEYAKKHDYQALMGYCASSVLAKRMMRHVPALDFAADPRTIRMKDGRVRVEFGDQPASSFLLEKHEGRWVVVAFHE